MMSAKYSTARIHILPHSGLRFDALTMGGNDEWPSNHWSLTLAHLSPTMDTRLNPMDPATA